MSGNEKSGAALPEQLRNLISRKLHVRRREQLQLYAESKKFAYAQLSREVMAEISARRFGRALISIPLATYGEIVDTARAITRSWPGTVWECITSLLNKAKVTSCNADELNAIVDEFAWGKEQQPFTYVYVAADKFMDYFSREVGHYGIQLGEYKTELNRQLKLTAATAEAGILNTARWVREEISIAIDEYVMSQQANNSNLVAPPIGDNHSAPCPAVNTDTPASAGIDQCEIFRNMKNLTSDELSLALVGDKTDSGLGSNNMLEVSARNQSRRITLGEFDLLDRRQGSLNSQGTMLLGMAHKLKALNNGANGKKISILRKILKKNLGVKDDPFDRTGTYGWSPRFQISDARGLADERAKQQAARQTISLDHWKGLSAASIEIDDSEYPFESEDDENGDWTKKNS